MTRTNKFLSFLPAILMSVIIISCVQDDDFNVPEDLGIEENKALDALLSSSATEISIADLKAKFAGNDHKAMEIDTDIYIKGYVSSSDKNGNFFKEIFLQNSPDNPTAGIKIIIDQVESYNQYNRGREVYVKLKGLVIGEERVDNGVATLGGTTVTNQFGTAVKRLTESQRTQHLFRSTKTAELVPLELTLSQASANHIGILVQFENVEFLDKLSGEHYFDPTQDFDTLRLLQSCSGTIGYSYFTLETSKFATFKDMILPTGNGSIKGVVTKTFDGSNLVLGLNDVNDVMMTANRCSPTTIEDFNIIFKEDFESARVNATLDFEGWTNFNEVGKVKWKEKNTDGNGYAEFSSFNSWDLSNIAWLITPAFSRNEQSRILLNFKSAQHHVISPNNTLDLLISTDYDGHNVLSATWINLKAALPSPDTPWYQFLDSGLIDLSSYSGTFHIAFKVTGSGTIDSLGGAYMIDDLVILAAD